MIAKDRPNTPRLVCWLVILAAIVGVAGYFGPWVPHRAAGLVIVGLDLGEYVKFLPEVIAGKIVLRRELFYLPLFAASLSASLLASRRGLPAWTRLLLMAAAVPLALAMLPPAWRPDDLRTSEYRLQAIGIALCLAADVAVLVTRLLPSRVVFAAIAVLALCAALWPTWGFLQIRPAIDAVYNRPQPLGWGFWASLLGFLAAGLVALSVVVGRGLGSRPGPRSPRS